MKRLLSLSLTALPTDGLRGLEVKLIIGLALAVTTRRSDDGREGSLARTCRLAVVASLPPPVLFSGKIRVRSSFNSALEVQNGGTIERQVA